MRGATPVLAWLGQADLHVHIDLADNPTLTVAIALAAGMMAQSLAYHVRIPSIVLLFALGVLLGPEVAGLVHPESLGSSVHALVGFAVAVILFEGGLQLDLRRLRREQVVIRRLVTIGAVITAIGGAVTARLVLGWNWRLAALFGTLVIVTGPTVVTPLLHRLRIQRTVATILEAEGVLIDAVGAITAAVVLEAVLRPSDQGILLAAPEIAARIGFGIAAGILGGAVLAFLLRFRNVIPEAFQNVMTLATVVLIYELSNAAIEESGLAAATVTGLVLANAPLHKSRELVEFKEQLTVLLIGLLFILLAADIRLADVTALGLPGVWTVVALVVVVRPVEVLVCSFGTTLSWKERLLLAWIAPRGVVAAAVASLFAFRLQRFGLEGGPQLNALVFTTIGATVLWSGLTGGLIARILGLQRPSNEGWIILGGSSLVQELAGLLQTPQQPVVCIDSDPHQVRETESLGLRVLHGNALEASVLGRAELDTRIGAVAATENPEVNLLFVKKARGMAKDQRYLIAIRSGTTGVTREMVHKEGAEVLFGGATDLPSWNRRLDEGEAKVECWSVRAYRPKPVFTKGENRPPYLPLVRRRGKRVMPVGSQTRFRRKDSVAFLIDDARRAQAHQHLLDAGFVRSTDWRVPP